MIIYYSGVDTSPGPKALRRLFSLPTMISYAACRRGQVGLRRFCQATGQEVVCDILDQPAKRWTRRTRGSKS